VGAFADGNLDRQASDECSRKYLRGRHNCNTSAHSPGTGCEYFIISEE
jgi:hypothetical protein